MFNERLNYIDRAKRYGDVLKSTWIQHEKRENSVFISTIEYGFKFVVLITDRAHNNHTANVTTTKKQALNLHKILVDRVCTQPVLKVKNQVFDRRLPDAVKPPFRMGSNI